MRGGRGAPLRALVSCPRSEVNKRLKFGGAQGKLESWIRRWSCPRALTVLQVLARVFLCLAQAALFLRLRATRRITAPNFAVRFQLIY
jgi:hypothetical protein